MARAKPYLRPALEAARPILQQQVRKALAGATVATLLLRLDLAVRTAAFFALKVAQDRCPIRTGRLKGSLNVQPRGTLLYSVGTNVEYARWVEFGTRRKKR